MERGLCVKGGNMIHNFMKLEISAVSVNESFARVTVAAFAAQLDPTVDEITELKTAVSEAVTNAIVHGYEGRGGTIEMMCGMDETGELTIVISDGGRGIENVELARQPFYTTSSDGERSGMGFSVMEAFMDSVEVESKPDEGTVVTMKKRIADTSERSNG